MQEYNSARPCRDAVQIELRVGGRFWEERVLVGMGVVGTKRGRIAFVESPGPSVLGSASRSCQVD
jgi:hypothetical protein